MCLGRNRGGVEAIFHTAWKNYLYRITHTSYRQNHIMLEKCGHLQLKIFHLHKNPKSLQPRRAHITVLRFGVKVAVVRYLNFSKIAKNGLNMQFKLILNIFCPKIDKLLHISAQFHTKPMTTSLSNCLKWQICYWNFMEK